MLKQRRFQGSGKRYRLVGTDAFRLQPGCEARFRDTRLPSYLHGKGQVFADLPAVPVVDAFSLNLTLSGFSQIFAEAKKPAEYENFLSHLVSNTNIKQHAIHLKEFEETIRKYDALRSQWPEYRPFRWIVHPESQVTVLVLLFLLNVATTGLTWIWIRRLSRRGGAGVSAPEPTPSEISQPLIRFRRRRRRQTTSEATV